MAAISFQYRSTKPKSNLIVRFTFRIEGDKKLNSKTAPTEITIDKSLWKEIKKGGNPRNVEKRNKIIEVNGHTNKLKSYLLERIKEIDFKLLLNDSHKNWFRDVVDEYYNPVDDNSSGPIPKSLIEYIDFYLEQREHEISSSLKMKFNVIKHKMERFQSSSNKRFDICDINENFKREFVKFYKKNHYSQNTTHRELGFIKTLCRHAKGNGIKTHPQLDSLKVSKEKVPKIWLSFDEIEQIEKVEGLKPYQENAKDWLIISCFTGQRVSDLLRFNKEMIRIENGKKLIEFTQKKTQKKMSIPLHSKVVEILNKRDGEFPSPISDQRYNSYIKEVCKKAKLNTPTYGKLQLNVSEDPNKSIIRVVPGEYPKYKLISSHVGRRSFATNFYGKIPTSLLISVTGHSTENNFRIYISKGNQELAMELTNYF